MIGRTRHTDNLISMLLSEAGSCRSFWEKLTLALNERSRVFLGVALLVNLAVTIVTNQLILMDFGNSGDEYAYQVSAQIMATGRFSVPSPEPPEFFTPAHVLNNGTLYSKYPPGWPLILSLGYLMGLPWVINPLVGLLTIFLLYEIARRLVEQDILTISYLCC